MVLNIGAKICQLLINATDITINVCATLLLFVCLLHIVRWMFESIACCLSEPYLVPRDQYLVLLLVWFSGNISGGLL